MLIRRFREFNKNKKGFSLVEAIAVVAIMGILSVIIASLLASSTKYYSKNADEVAAKEISKIVEKEIVRLLEQAKEIHLQNGADSSDLPTLNEIYKHNTQANTYITKEHFDELNETEKANYTQISTSLYSRMPFGGVSYKTFTSKGDEGYLMYSPATIDAPSSYFAQPGSSGGVTVAATFYGGYFVSVYFKAVQNGNGKFQSILVFADVYDTDTLTVTYDNSSKETYYEKAAIKKHRIFTSSGRLVSPIGMIGTTDTVLNYTQTNVTEGADGKLVFNNAIDESARYTYLHFRTA